MIDAIRWHLSFSRNPTFHEWMREQYSQAELKALVSEASEADLTHEYDPSADT